MAILERCERNNGKDAELRKTVERTVQEVVPRLLGDGHHGGKAGVMPVVVHGVLWSGNHSSKGYFASRWGDKPGELGPSEDVVYDPSSSFAHSEFEGGIMRMFGGFGSGFWREYHQYVAKTEPVGEYESRAQLYEVSEGPKNDLGDLLRGIYRLITTLITMLSLEEAISLGRCRYSKSC